jgi:hypothetical protein
LKGIADPKLHGHVRRLVSEQSVVAGLSRATRSEDGALAPGILRKRIQSSSRLGRRCISSQPGGAKIRQKSVCFAPFCIMDIVNRRIIREFSNPAAALRSFVLRIPRVDYGKRSGAADRAGAATFGGNRFYIRNDTNEYR